MTVTRLGQFFLLMIVITGIFVFKIIAGKFIFNQKTVHNHEQRTILKYTGTYTNAEFMGVPLVQALLGSNGVFFAVPYLICYNIFIVDSWNCTFSKKRGNNNK